MINSSAIENSKIGRDDKKRNFASYTTVYELKDIS